MRRIASVGGTGEVQGNPLRQTLAAISYLLAVANTEVAMATLNADVLNAFVGTPTEMTVSCRNSFLRPAGADNNRSVAGGSLRRLPSALLSSSNGFRCRPASIVRDYDRRR